MTSDAKGNQQQDKIVVFKLERLQLDEDVTIGQLTIAGHHICWTCEDAERPDANNDGFVDNKIPGKTAIPRGTYKVLRTYSPKFQRTMPQLMDVPGFTGIRIHTGNYADDTAGCILPGLERLPKGVGQSSKAYEEVIKWLDAVEWQGNTSYIQIVGPASEGSNGPEGS